MAEVKVYSFIGKKRNAYDSNEYISGQQFATALEAAAATDAEEIKVSINSGGGSVTDGYAMISAMQKSTKPVHAVIDGFAASMGYFICLGAKKITAAKNSIIMLHSVQGSASGTPEELRAEAEVLDKFNKAMATLLVARTGLTEEEVIAKYLGADLFLTAAEALDLKLIDGIENYDAENIPAVEAGMSFEQVEFKYAALHQQSAERGIIEKVLATVRTKFGLTEKPEPKAVMLRKNEKSRLAYMLYSVRSATDEAAYALKETTNPVQTELLNRIIKTNAAFVVEITNLVYGEEAADETTMNARVEELIATHKQKQAADITAQAETAATALIQSKLTEKDNAITAAQTEIQNLQARIQQLEAKPADEDEVFVGAKNKSKKPLTVKELNAKFDQG